MNIELTETRQANRRKINPTNKLSVHRRTILSTAPRKRPQEVILVHRLPRKARHDIEDMIMAKEYGIALSDLE